MDRKSSRAGAVIHQSSNAAQHEFRAWSTDVLTDTPQAPSQTDLYADLGNFKGILNT